MVPGRSPPLTSTRASKRLPRWVVCRPVGAPPSDFRWYAFFSRKGPPSEEQRDEQRCQESDRYLLYRFLALSGFPLLASLHGSGEKPRVDVWRSLSTSPPLPTDRPPHTART